MEVDSVGWPVDPDWRAWTPTEPVEDEVEEEVEERPLVGGGGGGGAVPNVSVTPHGWNRIDPKLYGVEDPMQYWIRTIPRMREVVASADCFRPIPPHSRGIAWKLPPLGQDPVVGAIAYIDRIVGRGWVRCFKIGLTHLLAERWCRADFGYRDLGYRGMVVLAVSDMSDDIANAETSVIARFRRYGPRGRVILDASGQPSGHVLCENRNPGGEGAHHGIAPFMLYVAWKNNPRGR